MAAPYIKIKGELVKQIAEEHECTDQTVRDSLRYFTNTEQSMSIRSRAKELLLEEAAKIKIDKNED